MKNKYGATAAGLIKDVSRLYALRLRIEADNLGIKSSYRPLLTQLYVKDGGSQLALSGKTGMKTPTVSITLRKMEKDGLVRRTADEDDLRRVHVYLTDKGRKITEDLNARIAQINEAFVAGMTEEQKAFFCESLEKAKEALK